MYFDTDNAISSQGMAHVAPLFRVSLYRDLGVVADMHKVNFVIEFLSMNIAALLSIGELQSVDCDRDKFISCANELICTLFYLFEFLSNAFLPKQLRHTSSHLSSCPCN